MDLYQEDLKVQAKRFCVFLKIVLTIIDHLIFCLMLHVELLIYSNKFQLTSYTAFWFDEWNISLIKTFTGITRASISSFQNFKRKYETRQRGWPVKFENRIE